MIQFNAVQFNSILLRVGPIRINSIRFNLNLKIDSFRLSSIQHKYFKDYTVEALCVEVVWDGTTPSIEAAQSQRGFGMVEESAMEQYLEESG